VTLEDMTGNIELVLFPRTWEKFRAVCEDGKVVLAIGKLDTATSPPKVLVDEIRTDFTMYFSADDQAGAEPEAVLEAPAAAINRGTYVRPSLPANAPARAQTSAPVAQKPQAAVPVPEPKKVAQAPADYVPEPDENDFDDDMPPEPEAPPDWEQFGTAQATHFASATPMDDMLEAERLAPAVENQKAAIQSSRVVVEPVATVTYQAVTAPAPVLPPIAPPMLEEPHDNDLPPRLITVVLRPSGDNDRDRRRIKNVYGILISAHGKDRFQFQVFENGRGHLIDFPNDTTRIAPDMLTRLKKLMGEETWRVEDITYQ